MDLRRLSLLSALLLVMLAPPAAADTRIDPLVFDALAEDLAQGLESRRSVIQGALEWAGLSEARAPRLAVLPFAPGETMPVPHRDALRFNDALSDALARRTGLGVDLVAREELSRIIADMANFDRNAWRALVAGANAEIRVVGTVTPLDDGVELSYRAVTNDGRTVASTRPRRLAFDWRHAAMLSFDAALEETAAALVAAAPDLKVLAVSGVLLQPGGGHTTLGHYLAESLAERLNKKVKLQRTTGVSVPLSKLEENGLNLLRRPVEDLAAADAPGGYVLSGSIFVLTESVDVVFKLRSSHGEMAHTARIARASLDPHLLPAPAASDPFAEDNQGPNAVALSTSRGRTPVYRPGDTVTLVVQAAEDGHLYCFVRQASGSIVRIFPNRHHAGTRIAGGRQMLIPGRDMAFEWTIEPPAGEDLVKCFVLDRDVWTDLPAAVSGPDFAPLPGIDTLDALRATFRALPRAAVSEATLRVTVAGE